MEHVVFFPAHDGSPAFRRVGALEDAVRLVEHLRNVEGIAEVSVHALSEVPLAFKTWYRVEVPGTDEAAPEAPAAEAAPDAAPVAQAPEQTEAVAAPVTEVPPLPEQAVVALATSNGHAVAGPSSLGFFAS